MLKPVDNDGDMDGVTEAVLDGDAPGDVAGDSVGVRVDETDGAGVADDDSDGNHPVNVRTAGRILSTELRLFSWLGWSVQPSIVAAPATRKSTNVTPTANPSATCCTMGHAVGALCIGPHASTVRMSPGYELRARITTARSAW